MLGGGEEVPLGALVLDEGPEAEGDPAPERWLELGARRAAEELRKVSKVLADELQGSSVCGGCGRVEVAGLYSAARVQSSGLPAR